MLRLPRHLMPDYSTESLGTAGQPKIYYPEVILPEPAEVDTPADISTELVYDPNNTQLDRPELNLVYTQSFGATVKEFYLYGTGWIWTGGIAAFGVATGLATWIVLDILTLFVAIQAWWVVNGAAMVGTLVFVIALLMLVSTRSGSSNARYAKPCPRSGMRGPIRID